MNWAAPLTYSVTSAIWANSVFAPSSITLNEVVWLYGLPAVPAPVTSDWEPGVYSGVRCGPADPEKP